MLRLKLTSFASSKVQSDDSSDFHLRNGKNGLPFTEWEVLQQERGRGGWEVRSPAPDLLRTLCLAQIYIKEEADYEPGAQKRGTDSKHRFWSHRYKDE